MAEDINKVMLVGRLTRDAELSYTPSGYALCKLGLAVNRRRKQGDQWIDEANFFDVQIWGKRGESLNQYLKKGTQIAVEGQLKQERWEQEGAKRSKVSIDASNIQLLGGKQEGQSQAAKPQNGHNQGGSMAGYQPPSQPVKDDYQDEIPF